MYKNAKEDIYKKNIDSIFFTNQFIYYVRMFTLLWETPSFVCYQHF